MTTASREQARFMLLEQWAAAANGAGYPVPARPHLVAIAQQGGVGPSLAGVREVTMWRPTISWLVQRADAGDSQALAALPSNLVQPSEAGEPGTSAPSTPPAPSPAAGGLTGGTEAPTREGRRFEALRAWHRDAVAAGAAGSDAVREMHLRLVANSHVSTATEIRAIFPPVVGRFADELAAALGGGARPDGGGTPTGGGGTPNVPGLSATSGLASPGIANQAEWVATGGPVGTGVGAPVPAGTRAHAAATPAAETPAAVTPAPSAPPPDLSVDPDGFAPYEFGAHAGDPAPLQLRRRPEGGIAVRWPGDDATRSDGPGTVDVASGDARDPGATANGAASDGAAADGATEVIATGVARAGESTAARRGADEVIIDRLIAADEYPPYSPDAARLVAATRGTEAVDELEFTHAARHYQVWRNRGTTIAAAKLAQPERVASGELVSPVLDFDLREDEGRVIGQWRVLPGTTRVQVFRIPVQRAAGASGDPQFRILHDDRNLGGFVDTQAERGARYLYQVFAEAEFDGVARLSAPTNHELLVSAVHEPVRDLSFELLDNADEPLFDLSWTVPPGGQVVVYRTEQPHQPGIERQATPTAALAQAGLPDSRRQSHPIVTTGDRASMRSVPWPRGWTRAYFTTVVLLGDRAFVGNTVRGVRVPKVSRPKLVERVNRQVLTFEWPEGADIVLAYKSLSGIDSEVAMQGQPLEVSRSDYREQGGLEFAAGVLDAQGCDLHLVSVAFDGGHRVLAAPEVVHYDGLLRIHYRIVASPLPDGRPLLRVQLRSEVDVEHAPPFVLVHNPERLPLTIGDGRPVAVVPDGQPGASVQRRFVPSPLLSRGSAVSTWVLEPGHLAREVPPTGYLRLFVDLPPDVLRRVALLDPPVSTLRLRAPQPPQGGAPGGRHP